MSTDKQIYYGSCLSQVFIGYFVLNLN